MVLLRWARLLTNLLAAAALFVLMVMTFLDVLLRSILNAPIEVAADMTRVLMAITVFSVMPALSAGGGQISVDLLDAQFRRFGLSRARDAVVSLFCGVILFWPASRVIDLAERARSYGDVMEYLGLPLFYIGWFIGIMSFLTALALVGRAVALVFAPRLLGHRRG
ncbi:MAG: TRAP transporter small permease subunit [Alphaproteobacteria bacterium]|nr:MAG: TRAP transporter small permease subunit [Alphaproteobacteria bacterium]